MNQLINISENGINMVVEKSEETGTLYLLHLSPEKFNPESVPQEEKYRKYFSLVEVHRSGEDQNDHHGAKHVCSNPGGSIGKPVYSEHRDSRNTFGRLLEFIQLAGDLKISSFFQFFDNIPVIQTYTKLTNEGIEDIPVEYVSSFALTGLSKDTSSSWDSVVRLSLAHNAWKSEFQWRTYTLPELGLSKMHSDHFSNKRVAAQNTGSWAAKDFMPMGCLENADNNNVYLWQIEPHGSWNWEISDMAGHLYLLASGPSERENHWFKQLSSGEEFISIPVATAICKGDKNDAFQAMNLYHRSIRRENSDNKELPVVFNDYMNCLMADPTTEKLLPLIDIAAELGADYYVIDAGWYADGEWWDSVGEWQESKTRFPNGLREVIDYIISKGVKPGLWLELERMGKNCSLASEWPDECFFCRHGKRVIEHNSLQLDFRHPIVKSHADFVIDKLEGGLNIKFIKMDYNIDIGPGTEVDSDSFGDGLLQHQRAYLDWLDSILLRYPDLVMENCASGGLRNTYSMLSRLPLCSTTDNENYLFNAKVSINSASAYCMEQAGVWSYPLAKASEEEVIMNMVSAMSWRIYLSGEVWALNEQKKELMCEGVQLYKNKLRKIIPNADPFWPLGFVTYEDKVGAFALIGKNGTVILSVWNFSEAEESYTIPLNKINYKFKSVKCIYPAKFSLPEFSLNTEGKKLEVKLKALSARIFQLETVS